MLLIHNKLNRDQAYYFLIIEMKILIPSQKQYICQHAEHLSNKLH